MKANKLSWEENKIEMPKAALLESYRSMDNDRARAQAIRYSKQHNIWVCVTFDGVLWEAWAHMPAQCLQAVIFLNGKFDSLWEQSK